MQTEVHEYDGGGVRSRGYLALPEGNGKRPGILIVHEAPGLDAHPKRRADMLATLEASLAPQGDEVRRFVEGYIAAHHIDTTYRWMPDRLVALEHAAIAHTPPIKLTVDRLQKTIMQLVSAVSQ